MVCIHNSDHGNNGPPIRTPECPVIGWGNWCACPPFLKVNTKTQYNMNVCFKECCINRVCYYFPFLMWIDKSHFSLLALPFWRRTPTSLVPSAANDLCQSLFFFLRQKPKWHLLCCLLDEHNFHRMWVKWELCQPGRMPAVALPLGSWRKIPGGRENSLNARFLVQKGACANWSASSLLPSFRPCGYDFISTEATLWSLFIPAGCHSDLLTNPGHTLRALIKQFAFFLLLFHLIERLQSLSMRLKDYLWILRGPTQLQLSVISWSGYLSVNISSLFSQVPGLLDLVRLARLVEE